MNGIALEGPCVDQMDDSEKPVVCLRLLTPSSSSGPSRPYAAVLSLAKFDLRILVYLVMYDSG